MTIVTASGERVGVDVLERSTSAIASRGPDGFGYAWTSPDSGAYDAWRDDLPVAERRSGVLFGHRRLSIVDLSDAGHQPFRSDDGSLVLSYNGEIYNFVELRSDLEAAGFRFRSSSDTEVLLNAYRRWGLDALSRLNGMWAFTLWDARERKLVASRDRFGVKPLYYTVVDGTWIFGSEIKALLEYPGAHRGFAQDNVREFIARGLLDHASESLFSGIYALPPATYLELRDGEAKERKYWDLPTGPDIRLESGPEAVGRLRETLADAVRVRTRCDVPIGTMLSGGLDSTAITALILDQRDRAGDQAGPATTGLQSFHETFTACWPDDAAIDETTAVDLMCARFGLASHKLALDGDTLRDLLPEVTYALDEPFETPVSVVQYLLMREARGAGIKVVLNGHGSDEALGGYPEFFVPTYLAQLLLSGRVGEFVRQWRGFGAGGQWNRRRLLQELVRGAVPTSLRGGVMDAMRGLSERKAGIFIDEHGIKRSRRYTTNEETMRQLPLLEAELWRKFSEVTLPKWLRMEDRMSMAHSVESRLPFMDYRLIELAFRLPSSLKLSGGYTKIALRKAVADLLPQEIVLERRKRRFATPYAGWMRGPWREVVGDLLLGGQPRIGACLSLRGLQPRLEAYLGGANDDLDSLTVWRIFQTEMWMRCFEADRSPRAPFVDSIGAPRSLH